MMVLITRAHYLFLFFPSAKEKNSTVHSLKKENNATKKKKKTKKKKPRECTVIFLVLVRQFFSSLHTNDKSTNRLTRWPVKIHWTPEERQELTSLQIVFHFRLPLLCIHAHIGKVAKPKQIEHTVNDKAFRIRDNWGLPPTEGAK